MHPFVKLGFFHIQSFSLFLAMGALLAVFVAIKKFSQNGLPPENVFYLATVCIISGTLGSRIFYILEFHDQYQWQIFYIFDGWYLWGGLLGIAFFFARRYYSLSFLTAATLYLRSQDIHILPVLIAAIVIAACHAIYTKKSYTKINYIAVLLCMVFFARLMFLYMHFESYSWGVFALYRGGMTVYGGLLLSLVCCQIYMYNKQMPSRKTFDIVLMVTFLALACGRMGCHFNGCCFGKKCSSSMMSVEFPTNSPVGLHQLRGFSIYHLWNTHTPEARSISSFLSRFPHTLSPQMRKIFFPPVYATQLFAVAYNLIIFLILWWLFPRKKYDGQVALWGICLYSFCRFHIEMFRGDNPFAISGLTGAQCISCALFCASLSIILLNILLSHKALNKRSMTARKEI